jgi:hypothetical protein
MSESKNVWDNNEEKEFWNFVGENKHMVGLTISDGQGLDILNALRDIYLTIQNDPQESMRMITLLATVIHASSLGEGKKLTDEIRIAAAMEQFDSSIKEILDEESK